MNPKALKTLEYNKIIDKLTEFAGSALAKEMCRNLQPSTDLYEIQALQKETSDALSRIYQKGAVSFRGVRDIRGSIKRLEIGAIIGINELLSICSLLEVCSKVKAYSRNDRDPDFEDSLEAMFQALQPLTPVSSEIRRCIASEEELNDDAITYCIGCYPCFICLNVYLIFFGQWFTPHLSAGFDHHNARGPLLYPGQSRAPRTDSGHDP